MNFIKVLWLISMFPMLSFSQGIERDIVDCAHPAPPEVTGPSPVCAGSTNTYEAASPENTYVKWQITGGTPTTAYGSPVSITWNSSGTYSISATSVMLHAPNCSSVPKVINIDPRPFPWLRITGPDTIGTDARGVAYNATADADQYEWSISQSIGAIQPGFEIGKPTHIITKHDAAAGIIRVLATTCGITQQATKIIRLTPREIMDSTSRYFHVGSHTFYVNRGDTCFAVGEAPYPSPGVTNFTVQLSCNENHLQVHLLDNSNTAHAAISQFSWAVDGSIVATSENTVVNHLDTGSHTVTLTVISGTDTNSLSRTIYIPALPTADFTWTPSGIVCEEMPVTFIPIGLNSELIHSYLWNFGDGTTSTLDTAVNQFSHSSLNVFRITLAIQDIFGCTSSYQQFLPIIQNRIEGIVSPGSFTGCTGDTVSISFDNLFSKPTHFAWSQYPGGPDIGFSNPITVNQSGSYTLTVSDRYGCRTTLGPVQVVIRSVSNPIIVGNLDICRANTAVPNLSAFVPRGLAYHFSATSNTTPPYSVSSNGFGSNQPVTLSMPVIPPSVHSLSVSLSFTDTASHCCSKTATATMVFHDGPPQPNLSLDTATHPTEKTLCILKAQIDTNSFPYPVTYSWNTGEQGPTMHAFTNGVYTVTVSDNYGCTASVRCKMYAVSRISNKRLLKAERLLILK